MIGMTLFFVRSEQDPWAKCSEYPDQPRRVFIRHLHATIGYAEVHTVIKLHDLRSFLGFPRTGFQVTASRKLAEREINDRGSRSGALRGDDGAGAGKLDIVWVRSEREKIDR